MGPGSVASPSPIPLDAECTSSTACRHGGSNNDVVVGRVIRVRRDTGGGWRVRLADTGGALAAAKIIPELPPPRVGVRIVLYGHVRYDAQHAWYTVDPAVAWQEVP